jgi:alkylation response protein AidB-like acyl-CoA dehydrogenase
MDLEPTDDQLALAGELRRFLADRFPRPVPDADGLWGELVAMGVLGLPLPEADGGVGLGWAEAVLAFEELGRAAVPGPFVTSAAAAAAGIAEPGGGAVGIVPAGSPAFVEHLDALDALLVLDAGAVWQVPLPLAAATSVERPLDPLTPVHVVAVLGAADAGVGRNEVGGPDVAASIGRHVALLAAATQVGLGQTAVELGTAYAGERHQFGRPIGSFQAVKHLLADAAVGVEVARAAVHAAAVTVDESTRDGHARAAEVDRAIAAARVVASGGARRATSACIQVHGGMGYTWELDAHLYFKRVLVLDQAPGTVDDALEVLAAAL